MAHSANLPRLFLPGMGAIGYSPDYGLRSFRPIVPDLDMELRLAADMAAAQTGDKRAYEALLRACLPIVAAMARRQGVTPDHLDDVVQDVLVTIHRARATYDPARPFLPWLRAIAQHRALDAIRRYGRHQGRETGGEDAYLDLPDPAPSATQRLEQADLKRQLDSAVAMLPPGQRLAVERLLLRDDSLTEAAADTGRTKGSLKVNLHRALKALRERLSAEPGADV